MDPAGNEHGRASDERAKGNLSRLSPAARTIHHAPAPDSPVSDEQLLLNYRRGDRESFARLVDRYRRELFHFLFRFLNNKASAEDVLQETFLQVHQSADTFDPHRRFRPWLFTIAANKARDLIRLQSRRPTSQLNSSMRTDSQGSARFIDFMESPAAPPSESMEKHETQLLVHAVIGRLPENMREILLLSYFHQYSYRQISQLLEIPLGTVKSRLHAAVAHFARRWRLANPPADWS